MCSSCMEKDKEKEKEKEKELSSHTVVTTTVPTPRTEFVLTPRSFFLKVDD